MGQQAEHRRGTGWWVAAFYVVFCGVLPLVTVIGSGSLTAIIGGLFIAAAVIGRARSVAARDYEGSVPKWSFWLLYGVIAIPATAALLLIVLVLPGGEWTAGAFESLAILVLALVLPLALPWLRHRRAQHRGYDERSGSIL